MSKITITPDGAGTGTFSIASPNSNTNRTLTLPDSDGTILTSVATADIVDANVTTAKIADANVTTAKIADANVTTAKIADVNVTQGKLADQAVNEAKLQVSNAPVDGYMLTAESANTGGLTWAAAPTSSTTAGDVGTYSWGGPVVNTATAIGATSSSFYAWRQDREFNLMHAQNGSVFNAQITIQSGTWRCMTGTGTYQGRGYSGLWVRIS